MKKILLIDDDEMLQELIAITIECEGHEVLKADNGRSGLEIVDQQHVDLIILDMMMPVMDGLSFLHWLRDEKKSTIPVLALTGMGSDKNEKEIISAGATQVLFKPIEIDDLVEAVEPLLSDH